MGVIQIFYCFYLNNDFFINNEIGYVISDQTLLIRIIINRIQFFLFE
jgi:hypothetical protein